MNNFYKKIYSRAPLRISFAGGGSDIEAFSSLYGGAIINATINKYVYCQIETRADKVIEYHVYDEKKNVFLHHSVYEESPNYCLIHKNALKYFIEKYGDLDFGLTLTTYSDVPKGSGLGGSSSLTVALIKALFFLYNIEHDAYQLARIAYYVERVMCKLSGGMQDQFSAAFGGLNFIECSSIDSTFIKPIPLSKENKAFLEASILLYFNGSSRDSATIIEDQKNSLSSKDQLNVENFKFLKQEALHLRDNLIAGNFQLIPSLINRGWQIKKNTSKKITNEKIEKIIKLSFKFGATAVKLSGAGGGGFFFLFVPFDKKYEVSMRLKAIGGDVLNLSIIMNGAEAWS